MAIQNATVNLAVESAIGVQNYAEAGYFPLGYFSHTLEAAEVLESTSASLTSNLSITASGDAVYSGVVSPSVNSSVITAAGEIQQTAVSISINGQVGQQNYVESGYIVEGYFTANTTAGYLQSAQATLSSQLAVGGALYVESGYIELGYFEQNIDAQIFVGAEIDTAIAGTVTLTANVDADAVITMSSNASVLVTALGTIFDADASLSSTSSLSADAGEVTQGEVSVSITGTTSILATADLAGTVAVSIAATTSIQANAESSGQIEPGITVTLTCSASVLRINPRYTLIIPKETRVNTITQETRQVIIPKQTRELEFFV